MERIPTPLPKIAQQVEQTAKAPPQQIRPEIPWRKTVSTGSTLLDKAISGLKTRYGGLPGGILIEISGPPGSSKTTILGEIIGSVQRQGGQARIKDSEARLDADYCKQMGVNLPMAEDPESGFLVPDSSIYSVPKTVTDVIESIIGPLETKTVGTAKVTKRNWDKAWQPDPAFINCEGVDSLAALSTRMEMEQGDKMGQRRAKEFSEGLRIICSHIKDYNILMACSNQLRDNVDGGMFSPKTITPGGHAISFYASVRIQLKVMGRLKKGDIITGKQVEAFISKNSLDIEYRTAPLRIIFGYGIDDLGANLQWLKDNGGFVHPTDPSKKPGYVVGEKNFAGLEAAIQYAEDNNLEQAIKDQVVNLWDRLELEARPQRKAKVR